MAATILSSIQTGQKIVSSSDSSDTVTITSVDTSKSILLYSFRLPEGANSIGTRLVGSLTDSDTITFYKDDTGDDIVVEWKVLEFSSGVYVQHGMTTVESDEIDITVNAVTLANSFVLTDGHWSGQYTRSPEKPNGWLTSTTNVRIKRGADTSGIRSVFQCIQIDNATVQTGELVLTSVSDTETISSVTTSKTFAQTASSDENGVNVQGADDWAISVELTNSTTLTFRHEDNSRSYSCRWHVVSISDVDFSVQRGDHDFGSVDAEDITLSPVDTDFSVALMGGHGGHMARTSQSGTSSPPYPSSAATNKITSSTTLEVECDGWSSGETTTLDWQVLTFPAEESQIILVPSWIFQPRMAY